MSPRPRRRPGRLEPSWRWRLVLFFLAMLLGAAVAVLWWTWRGFQPASATGQKQIFKVEEGQSLTEISRGLYRAGLIPNARAFRWGVERWGLAQQLKHGAYELAPTMSPRAIAEKMARGDVAVRTVTIPEGFTVDQIAARLAANEVCEAQAFKQLARGGGPSPAEAGASAREGGGLDKLMGMKRPKSGWEGYLFPKTYTIPYEAGAQAAVEMMLKQFLSETRPLRPPMKKKGLGLHQVVTLASLVEREAKLDSERPVIAGVYYNRLKAGMKLQCDATVVYAWARQGVQKQRLLYADLAIDSPYNTYLHKGLPVGPIASPGLKSLEAAVHPADTDYLFYVAAGDGSHLFSRTPAEHEAAKLRVRAGLGQKAAG